MSLARELKARMSEQNGESTIERVMNAIHEYGQEPVLREVCLAAHHYRDQEVGQEALQALNEVRENMDLDPELLDDCPVCNTRELRFHECRTCGFSFIEDWRCPFLDEENRTCKVTGNVCELIGLEYESCGIFERAILKDDS